MVTFFWKARSLRRPESFPRAISGPFKLSPQPVPQLSKFCCNKACIIIQRTMHTHVGVFPRCPHSSTLMSVNLSHRLAATTNNDSTTLDAHSLKSITETQIVRPSKRYQGLPRYIGTGVMVSHTYAIQVRLGYFGLDQDNELQMGRSFTT